MGAPTGNINGKRHGFSHLPEYFAWMAMRERCLNPKNKSYVNYGARGISICARWVDDVGAFIADVGLRPSDKHSIDRIDVNGDYEPSNCRWATRKVQANNRRGKVTIVEFRGKRQNLSEWAFELGITAAAMSKRLREGWSIERALTTPRRGSKFRQVKAPHLILSANRDS